MNIYVMKTVSLVDILVDYLPSSTAGWRKGIVYVSFEKDGMGYITILDNHPTMDRGETIEFFRVC